MLHRLILPLALLMPLPAAAQNVAASAEDEEEGTACILIATRWIGGSEHVRDIEQDPVPEGFREQYESTAPCNSLLPESLIDWHLAFGTERTAIAALAYLERGRSRVIRTPERQAEAIERAWRAARDDLEQARALHAGAAADGLALERAVRRSEAITRLRSLVYGSDSGYLFLAEQYLRVAEGYGALSLLEQAEGFLGADLASTRFLARFDEQSLEARLFARPSYLLLESDDLEMRAAVLRARLTRTSEAIARAEATLGAKEAPSYRGLAAYAYTGGEDFCDLSSGAGDALETACREQSNISEQVTNYMASRAVLDLAKDEESALDYDGSAGSILRLLAAERNSGQGRCCRSRPNAEIAVDLSMAVAEFYGRRATTSEEILDNDPLQVLEAAEHVVPPYEQPSRFRRVAHAWLDHYRVYAAARIADDRGLSPRDERHAAYLERVLADLSAIAVGDGG